MPSFSDFRSDSPLLLVFGLWLSLSCWACGLVCALASDVTRRAVRCSSFPGLRGATDVPTGILRRLCRCPTSSGPTLYLIECCRGRIEFAEPSAGITSRLPSITSDTRLTGDGRQWPLKCVSHRPVATGRAVRSDPARHVLVWALTSNRQSTRCEPRQQTALHRAPATGRLATPACIELSAYWQQLAHPPSRERKGLCLTVEEL